MILYELFLSNIEEISTEILFEPGNVEELAEKMRCLLENPNETIRIGKNARAKMEREYNPELHYQSLIKVYEAVDVTRKNAGQLCE